MTPRPGDRFPGFFIDRADAGRSFPTTSEHLPRRGTDPMGSIAVRKLSAVLRFPCRSCRRSTSVVSGQPIANEDADENVRERPNGVEGHPPDPR